ncbi:uncharacterized protein LOC127260446 [Andrographis paniculata]|uniref:uncharacterized protein LOC127260445 n=1 Tax=Andrographis paniculata TaxID=175694 RepID=UPI0021E96443|nr:uncharacterized protein LOC127260445 [Andrographis paniculata]XP_051144136.1 uncharacterized protein LOC127260446 [Andrographis paniculata]
MAAEDTSNAYWKSKSKERWTEDEEESLQMHVLSQEGTTMDWETISQKMPGRSLQACETRWYKTLLPKLQLGGLDRSKGKIRKIRAEEAKRKPNWATVAKFLPPPATWLQNQLMKNNNGDRRPQTAHTLAALPPPPPGTDRSRSQRPKKES